MSFVFWLLLLLLLLPPLLLLLLPLLSSGVEPLRDRRGAGAEIREQVEKVREL